MYFGPGESIPTRSCVKVFEMKTFAAVDDRPKLCDGEEAYLPLSCGPHEDVKL